jgi:hypothetical protein
MTLQYESGDDDISSFVTSLSICLTTLGGMVLITRDSPMGGDSFSTAFLSAFLIATMTGTIAFEVVMVLLSTPVGNRLRVCCCRTRPSKPRGVAPDQTKRPRSDSASSASAVRITPVVNKSAVEVDDELSKLRTWGKGGAHQ